MSSRAQRGTFEATGKVPRCDRDDNFVVEALYEGSDIMGFFLEVLIGGLRAGGLYSLVALGFVLIFKASGVFNFAQGAMVLTAALALVRALELTQEKWHWPFGLALVAAFLFAGAVMAIVAWVAERLVLRKLVNQEGIILFMATIGVTFFLHRIAPGLFTHPHYHLHHCPP